VQKILTLCKPASVVHPVGNPSNAPSFKLNGIFGDNMILQRGINTRVWGNAAPETHITAELGIAYATAKADKVGKWMVHFPKYCAGGPNRFKIFEMGKLDVGTGLKGIINGDFWMASGQSNIEWKIQRAQGIRNEITKADFHQIRFFFVGQDKKLAQQTNILTDRVKICDTTNVKQFSSVAYYFARKIHQEQNFQIGIIKSTWGHMPMESYFSHQMLLSSAISRNTAIGNDTLAPDHFFQDSFNTDDWKGITQRKF